MNNIIIFDNQRNRKLGKEAQKRNELGVGPRQQEEINEMYKAKDGI